MKEYGHIGEVHLAPCGQLEKEEVLKRTHRNRNAREGQLTRAAEQAIVECHGADAVRVGIDFPGIAGLERMFLEVGLSVRKPRAQEARLETGKVPFARHHIDAMGGAVGHVTFDRNSADEDGSVTDMLFDDPNNGR